MPRPLAAPFAQVARLASPIVRGQRAAKEYEELALAFMVVREGYTKQAMAANSPEQAYDAVLKAKALQEVESQMLTVIGDGRIEANFQPD